MKTNHDLTHLVLFFCWFLVGAAREWVEGDAGAVTATAAAATAAVPVFLGLPRLLCCCGVDMSGGEAVVTIPSALCLDKSAKQSAASKSPKFGGVLKANDKLVLLAESPTKVEVVVGFDEDELFFGFGKTVYCLLFFSFELHVSLE